MKKNRTLSIELSIYSFLTLILIMEAVTSIFQPISMFSSLVIIFFAIGRLTMLHFSSPDQSNPISNIGEIFGNLSNHAFSTLLSISLVSLFSLFLGLNGLYSISIVTSVVCLYTLLMIFSVWNKYSLSLSYAARIFETLPELSLRKLNQNSSNWQKVYFMASLVILSFVHLDRQKDSNLENLEFYLLSDTGNFDDLGEEFQVGETFTIFAEIKGESGVELSLLCTITNMENGESEEIYSSDFIIQDGESSVPLSINLLSEGPRLVNFYLYSDDATEPIRNLYYNFEVIP